VFLSLFKGENREIFRAGLYFIKQKKDGNESFIFADFEPKYVFKYVVCILIPFFLEILSLSRLQ
jgi:hypothetical protein